MQTFAFAYPKAVPLVLSRLCLHRGTLESHVTGSWQEVLACPAAGTGICTLTFGDIITVPIRSLFCFIKPDELVRVSTWDGGMGPTWVSPWAQTDTRSSNSCWILMHHMMQCQHGNWVPSICIRCEHLIIHCLSLQTLAEVEIQTLHPCKRQMLWSAVRAVQLPC